jgi:fructose-1,6-bisphosphatase I
VADFHRNLLKGGIYICLATGKAPKGKLRLMYECNPLAFIVEQAGGRSSDGRQHTLSIEPKDCHARCPIFIGSQDLVEQAEAFIAQETGTAPRVPDATSVALNTKSKRRLPYMEAAFCSF